MMVSLVSVVLKSFSWMVVNFERSAFWSKTSPARIEVV